MDGAAKLIASELSFQRNWIHVFLRVCKSTDDHDPNHVWTGEKKGYFMSLFLQMWPMAVDEGLLVREKARPAC